MVPAKIRLPMSERLLRFNAWLNKRRGRAQAFRLTDPIVSPPAIAKMRRGVNAITTEMALRIELAQVHTDDPLMAEQIATYDQDVELIHRFRLKVVTDFINSLDPAVRWAVESSIAAPLNTLQKV